MTKLSKSEKIQQILDRGVEQVIVREDLERKLLGRKPLRIKIGIDPTGDRIHIGHAIMYWKLRELQELGHQVIILIGDYTAVVGDSSDKDAERQMQTTEQVKQNMRTYLKQIGLIVDLERAEVRYNSEWLKKLSFLDVLELASEFKVAQMLERDNFRERYEAGKPIGLQEFLYPVMQGYDSVALHADLELGGNDQLFNVLAGRTLQKRAGQEPQAVMVMELLIGTDGKKMSKSQPNCIFVTDTPLDMYGKVMALNDELIPHYFKLATTVRLDVIAQIEQNLSQGDNPRDTKAALAREIVARYHGDGAAIDAENAWEKQFRKGDMPDEIDVYRADDKELADGIGLLANAFGVTKSEVRRLLDQGGVKIDGDVISGMSDLTIKSGTIAQLGKRRFKKIQV
ncbi:tyrosine--tRNA ligase [bacterium]|nr:tyrosine--tRNA ligase [bacterium]